MYRLGVCLGLGRGRLLIGSVRCVEGVWEGVCG